MKLWVDDVRPAPEGYVWCRSVNVAKKIIELTECQSILCKKHAHNALFTDEIYTDSGLDYGNALIILERLLKIELIDLDHDSGYFFASGGDYINLLNWLEETGRNYPIRIHSMNPVGVANMRRIIQRNGWTEVK